MSWLSDRFEESIAQINPFDKGKSAVTVRRNRQFEAARTKKLEDNLKSPEWRSIQQKANTRNTQNYKAGKIGRQEYAKQRDVILGSGAPIKQFELSTWERFNKELADNTARNAILRPALVGAASLSPTNLVGNVTGYAGRAGRALGWDNGRYLAQAGDSVAKMSQADPEGEFRARGLGDQLITGGIELLGDISNPVNAALAPVKYGTRSANDLAREMESTGRYTPQQSFAAGTGLGVTSALLERAGLDKITGKAVSKGIRGVTTRLVGAGLTEGATEGAQQFAENLARNRFVNRDQSLTEGIAQSALVGGLLGAGARGGVEVAGRYGGLSGKQQLKQDVGAVKKKYKDATRLPFDANFTDGALAELTDYADYKMQRYNPGKRTNQLINNARNIAKEAGIDISSGSPVEIQQRITDFVDAYRNTAKQGGFIGNRDANSVDPQTPQSRTISTASQIQQYTDFNNFYKDYQNFFKDNGYTKTDAKSIFESAQNQPILPAGGANTRNSSVAQTQFEQAYNTSNYEQARSYANKIEDPVARQEAINSINKAIGQAPTESTAAGVTNPAVLKMMEAARKRKIAQGETSTRNKGTKDIANRPNIATKEELDSLLGSYKQTTIQPSERGLQIVNEEIGAATKSLKGKKTIQTSQPDIKTKIEGDFKDSTNQYLGTILDSETQARLQADSLPKLSKSKNLQAIQAIDSGVKTGDVEVDTYVSEFKKLTDNLYAKYRNQGIDMGYVDNYLPRIYKNPETGAPLTRQEFQLLQTGTGRTKSRQSQTVRPENLIYQSPQDLLGHYTKTMEKVVAGRQYSDNLLKQGYITYATERPKGMKLVDAEGLSDQGGLNPYATPEVADTLNKVFGSQTENKALKKVARLSSVAQDIGLSGGLPGTPLNSFSFAQGLREVLSGNVKGPVIALSKSFRKQDAAKYFKKNANYVSEMQRNGIGISSEYNLKALRELSGDIAEQDGKLARTWDKVMSDPTFKRFLPIMQVEMYKTARQHTDAKTATQTVKNFYGLTDLATQRTRSRNLSNLTTATLFAPRYREAMVKFWVNNAKSLKSPTNPEYRQNVKFMAGATVMFGVMQALNVALNGVPTWDNPEGKKDKLLVPGLPGIDGKVVGVPFLSSIATVPRNVGMGVYNAVTQNPEEVKKNVKSFVSYAGRPVLDLLDNENYFGQRIINEEDSTGKKAAQSASYLTEAYMHPYIREGINLAKNKLPEGVKDFVGARNTTPAQSLAQALETPLRFYNPDYFEGGRGEFATTQKNKDQIAISDSTTKNKSGKYTSRTDYDAILNAFTKSDNELKNVQKYGNTELKQAISRVAEEAKGVFTDLGLPTDNVKFDSRTARDYASLKKSIENANSIEKEKKIVGFIKDSYKSSLDNTTRSFYQLSDAKMRTELEKGTISKKQFDKAIEIDNLLTKYGLQAYPQIGKKLRADYGYGQAGVSSKSAKSTSRSTGSSGSRSRFKYSLFYGGGDPVKSTNASLRSLLEKAVVG